MSFQRWDCLTSCNYFNLYDDFVSDYVSIRNTEFGSWFIQAVAYVFSKFAHKNELLHLMIKVSEKVAAIITPVTYL